MVSCWRVRERGSEGAVASRRGTPSLISRALVSLRVLYSMHIFSAPYLPHVPRARSLAQPLLPPFHPASPLLCAFRRPTLAAYLATRAGGAAQQRLLNGYRAAFGGALIVAVTGGAATLGSVKAFISGCMSPGNETRVLDNYGSVSSRVRVRVCLI